jgi:hypothetical protein
VAVALGLLLLNEQFTVGMGIGFPLILVGSVLAVTRKSKQVPSAETTGEADVAGLDGLQVGDEARA